MHVIEKCRLNQDRTRLVTDVFLEDLEYLAELLSSTMEWIYAPDAELLRVDCDLDVTRQFIPQ